MTLYSLVLVPHLDVLLLGNFQMSIHFWNFDVGILKMFELLFKIIFPFFCVISCDVCDKSKFMLFFLFSVVVNLCFRILYNLLNLRGLFIWRINFTKWDNLIRKSDSNYKPITFHILLIKINKLKRNSSVFAKILYKF